MTTEMTINLQSISGITDKYCLNYDLCDDLMDYDFSKTEVNVIRNETIVE